VIKRGMHLLVWVIFFFSGVIEIIGLPVRLLNLLALGVVFLLFVESFRRKKIRLPHLSLVIGLAAVSWVSGALLNSISMIPVFFYFRQLILLQYMYLIIIVNEVDGSLVEFIGKTLLVMFFIQPFAAIFKLATIGSMESYIGTMSIQEGSLTTVTFLIAFGYLFVRYVQDRKPRMLVIMLLFILFALTGEKRAVIIFLPPMLVILLFAQAYFNKVNVIVLLRTGLLVITLSVGLIYAVVRLNPTLNPEREVLGTFDLGYTLDYIDRYSNRGTNLQDMSRLQALQYLSQYIYSQDMQILLFGEGAGKLSEATIDSDKSPVYYYYGIRYGGRMGIAWIFLQTGFVGLALYLYLFLSMLKFVLNKSDDSAHKLLFLAIWIPVIIDLSIYSLVSIRYFVISGTLFFAYGYIYRKSVRKPGMGNHEDLSRVEPGADSTTIVSSHQ